MNDEARRQRGHALWRVQLGLGVAMIAAYYTVVPTAQIDHAFILIASYGIVSVFVGVQVWRPRNPSVWHLLALAVVSYVVGDILFTTYTARTGSEPPVPSLADLFYYLWYPLLGASVILALRRQVPGRDRAGAVDAALITVAAAVLSWTYLMAPYANDDTLPLTEKLASIGYPIGDLLLVALVVSLLLVPGERFVTYRLLVAALMANLIADGLYLFQTLAGTYESGSLTDLWWLLTYVLLGTAAMHPSMVRYGQPALCENVAPSRRRLVMMTFAALTAPALILFRAGRDDFSEIGVIALGCMVMFVLVLVRLKGLLDEVETQHDQLQSAFADLQLAQSDRQMLLDGTVRAREHERSSLAADLHDGPIQRLSALSLTLDRAMLRLDRGDHALAGTLLERGQGELEAEVDELRRMMSALRPPILDEAGFEAGVRDLVADFGRRTEVAGHVTGTLSGPLEPDVETALYRVVQEALWNVKKHAEATAVEVRLRDLPDSVEMIVADNGLGFEPTSPRSLLRDGHFGLVGMRERLESAGGMLIIESRPGHGTRLVAQAPCSAGHQPQPRALGGAA